MQEGMPASSSGVRGGKVEIETVKAINWYIERQIRAKGFGGGEDNSDTADINEKRRLLLIEQTRKLEIENDEAELLLVPIEDVRIAFNAAITQLNGLLDGAAGKMSSGDAVLRGRLFDEHRRIRELFADRLEGFVDAKGGGELNEAASEEGCVEVGDGQEGSATGVG